MLAFCTQLIKYPVVVGTLYRTHNNYSGLYPNMEAQHSQLNPIAFIGGVVQRLLLARMCIDDEMFVLPCRLVAQHDATKKEVEK